MGTLRVPEIVPSPTQDSERLRKAFEGWGSDKKAIVRILGHRNANQRRKIRDTYEQLYNESLIDRLQYELYSDLKNAIILWTYDPPERDAKLVKDALRVKKKGIKHLQVLVEISCASCPDHLAAVRRTYCSLFDCSLEEDIIASVSGSLKKVASESYKKGSEHPIDWSCAYSQLLVVLVSSFRYDAKMVDINVANLEAIKLHEAIKIKQLDHDDVVRILSTRNFFQLRLTFECYKHVYGTPIDQDIKCCGNGDLEAILRCVVWCIDSPWDYFAEVVRASIVGLGTDEESLTRAIVTRAEIDMSKIREVYVNMNKATLDDAVIGDTSGYYRDFLLTLLGAKF